MAIKDGEQYEQVMESIAESIKPRALALLGKVRDELTEAGYLTDPEPCDMSSDDYRYALSVCRPGACSPVPAPPNHYDTDLADITVEIAEAREYGDDEAHDGYGVNFGLDIVEIGGRILGGLTPFNYTDECWVDARDPEAVEARWALLEGTDVSEIPSLIGDRS